MKIKEVKCPNCSANVKVKNNNKGICEYCHSEIILDDETIKVEHRGTIEINDDTSLEIAKVTLNKFKDYDKSLFLYRQLLYKYAHKDEVYIGLIRSITKDFQSNINYYQLNEINEYWQKYISLANNENITKYEDSIKELNKNYWYNELIDKTNNFNSKIKGRKIEDIEKIYRNYLNYCNEIEKETVNRKYNPYLKEYSLFLQEITKKRKKFIKLFISSIVIILLIIITFFLTEKTNQLSKSIKLSEFNEHYYVIKNDYQYFQKYFKDTISDLTITNINLNNEKKTIDITVSLKNILIEKTKIFNFKVVDDTGPIITPTSCKFTDTDTVNLYECFTLYDFTDGYISSEKAIINKNNIDFKKEGNKTITVSIADKDGNTNELKINVLITKTPIELQLNITDKMIVGNTYNLSYNITPNNVSNKEITYRYDEDLFEINNNKITALKKGQGEICITSNYDNTKKQCKNINLELQCKNTYIFKFDGSKEETITSNEVFCPGTYKIYASVMNKNDFYHLDIKPKGEFIGDTMTIYKNSSFLNEEGKKYNLTEGYTITTEIGIKEVKLVKQK